MSEAADSRKAYDAMYLDFSKAFDIVPHERLIGKVEVHGVGEEVLRWIKEWHRDRKQTILTSYMIRQWDGK